MHVKLNFVFVHFIGGQLRLVVDGAKEHEIVGSRHLRCVLRTLTARDLDAFGGAGGTRDDVADPKSDPGKLDGNVDPFMLLGLIKVVLLEAGQHCLP